MRTIQRNVPHVQQGIIKTLQTIYAYHVKYLTAKDVINTSPLSANSAKTNTFCKNQQSLADSAYSNTKIRRLADKTLFYHAKKGISP